MARISILFFIIVFLFISSGCGVDRCTRFFNKNPQCFTADTVVTYDTIIEKEVEHDTTLIPTGDIDTFYIEKENVRTRIIRVRDTLRVTTTIEADTVIVPKYIIKKIPKPIVKKVIPQWIWYLIALLGGVIIALWLYLRSK